MIQNPNCDGGHCISEKGQVRVYPLGGGSNLILCLGCFNYENNYRIERNFSLSKDCQFDIPMWKDLKVYLD